jgi:hypothetical protein
VAYFLRGFRVSREIFALGRRPKSENFKVYFTGFGASYALKCSPARTSVLYAKFNKNEDRNAENFQAASGPQ